MQTDRGLKVGPIQRLAEQAAKFSVHADVDVGVDEARHVRHMAAEREDHVNLRADAFNQPADFRQIGGHVEDAVGRPDDIDARLGARRRRLALGRVPLLRAELGPQPAHRAIGALPLVLVDRARQEPLNAGAFRGHPAADHLGDRAGDDDARQVGIERLVRAAHRAFRAVAAEFFFRKAGDDDRQFVRRQRVGIMQHRRDGQVFAAHRAVDDDLKSLYRGENVNRAPIAAGPIVIED